MLSLDHGVLRFFKTKGFITLQNTVQPTVTLHPLLNPFIYTSIYQHLLSTCSVPVHILGVKVIMVNKTDKILGFLVKDIYITKSSINSEMVGTLGKLKL